MNKLILTSSYDFDTPAVQMADIHSRGVDKVWMQKRAAVLTDEISGIRPEPGRTHLHVIAMGATENFGPNRNADGFKEAALMSKHATFVTNGHVYKHHKNKDPQKASGIVKFSAYNKPMHRVELIIAVDNNMWGTELEKLASGEDLPLSMACKVAHDVCNVCGNSAPSRDKYCQCMKKCAGQILADGRQVYVDNPDPTFFDISAVFRPADRIAYTLQKVANAGITTGAELADIEGLNSLYMPVTKQSAMSWRKRAMIRKLSDIEKNIDAVAPSDSNVKLQRAFSEPDDAEIEKLTAVPSEKKNKLFGALKQAHVCLPVKHFMRVVLGGDWQGVTKEAVEACLPGIFTKLANADDAEVYNDGAYDPEENTGGLSVEASSAVTKLAKDLSLRYDFVGSRIDASIIHNSSVPKMLTTGSGMHNLKTASVNAGAEVLAREYAKYKLAFLTKAAEHGESELLVKLGVLQNYFSL